MPKVSCTPSGHHRVIPERLSLNSSESHPNLLVCFLVEDGNDPPGFAQRPGRPASRPAALIVVMTLNMLPKGCPRGVCLPELSTLAFTGGKAKRKSHKSRFSRPEPFFSISATFSQREADTILSGPSTNRATDRKDPVPRAHCRILWAMIPLERLPMLYTVRSPPTSSFRHLTA